MRQHGYGLALYQVAGRHFRRPAAPEPPGLPCLRRTIGDRYNAAR